MYTNECRLDLNRIACFAMSSVSLKGFYDATPSLRYKLQITTGRLFDAAFNHIWVIICNSDI